MIKNALFALAGFLRDLTYNPKVYERKVREGADHRWVVIESLDNDIDKMIIQFRYRGLDSGRLYWCHDEFEVSPTVALVCRSNRLSLFGDRALRTSELKQLWPSTAEVYWSDVSRKVNLSDLIEECTA